MVHVVPLKGSPPVLWLLAIAQAALAVTETVEYVAYCACVLWVSSVNDLAAAELTPLLRRVACACAPAVTD